MRATKESLGYVFPRCGCHEVSWGYRGCGIRSGLLRRPFPEWLRVGGGRPRNFIGGGLWCDLCAESKQLRLVALGRGGRGGRGG